MRFSTSLLMALAPALALGFNRDETWSSGMSQQSYEHHVSLYKRVASLVAEHIFNQMPDGEEAEQNFGESPKKLLPSKKQIETCSACTAGMKLVEELFRSDFAHYLTMRVLQDACWLATFAVSHEACALTVEQAVPTIMTEASKFLVTPTFACEQIFGYCDTNHYIPLSPDDYAAQILKYKPSFLQSNDYIDFLYKEISFDQKNKSTSSPRKTIDLIQFTDIHVDFDYAVGSSINCGDVLCCRAESGFPQDPSNQAGKYGAVGFCDIPVSVIDKMADKINELNPDAVFWTGDVPPHDMWNYSQEYEEKYQHWFFEYLQQNMSSQRIYPLEGNHDFGEVINSQDFTKTDPILDVLAGYWSAYLGPEALEQFKKNGYYTETFVSRDGTVYEDTKIIAINTEACYNMNLYLLSNRNDPGDLLAWLEDVLLSMEANGQKAILIGHHPPSDDSCIYGWSKRFQALMDRFQNVVRTSFFGHVHTEQHNLLRSYSQSSDAETNTDQMSQPIGVQYWTGSLTTYHDTYPTFRRFVLDAEFMVPVRVETWILDVNQLEPEFEMDHELTEYYGMVDLSPSSFESLSQQMEDDEELALRFHNTKRQNGPNSKDKCDEKCRKQANCQTGQSTYIDVKLCQGEKASSIITDPVNSIGELMLDPWYEFHWINSQQQIE